MPQEWAEIVTGIAGLATLVAIVGTRVLGKGRVQFQLSDAIIAVVAAFFVLLLTGRVGIEEFGLSDKGFVAKLIRTASERKIGPQVSIFPLEQLLEQLEVSLKAGTADIPRLVEMEIPALAFKLGSGFYTPEAIQQYLVNLTQHPFLRFVIILKQDGQFFGMLDARKLLRTLRDQTSGWNFSEFGTAINRGNTADQMRLSMLPGLVPADKSVQPDSDKLKALERMEKLHIDWLPVVAAGNLKGVVERSALTASMVVDVAKQLRNSEGQ
jgi:hypothetical protein